MENKNNFKFVPNHAYDGRNEIIEIEDGIFLSYNNGESLYHPDQKDETAIVMGDDYLILNGDFRDEFEKILNEKGFKALIEFYKENKAEQSSWATNKMDLNFWENKS